MEEIPKTRKDALVVGAARYFSGKPCKNGHVAERFSLDGSCVPCRYARNAAARPALIAARRAARLARQQAVSEEDRLAAEADARAARIAAAARRKALAAARWAADRASTEEAPS